VEARFGIHAGRDETAVMLALRPDLVRMDKARNFVSRWQAVSTDTPSMAPDEAGTAGINRGAGGGSELLMDMPRATTPSVMDTINKLVMFDDTGEAEFIAQNFSGF
jgi:hypothetical protein